MISIEGLFKFHVMTYSADISAATTFQTIHRHVSVSCHSIIFYKIVFLFNCFTIVLHTQRSSFINCMFLSFTLHFRKERKQNFQSQFTIYTSAFIYLLIWIFLFAWQIIVSCALDTTDDDKGIWFATKVGLTFLTPDQK